jgi:hypothetical protein
VYNSRVILDVFIWHPGHVKAATDFVLHIGRRNSTIRSRPLSQQLKKGDALSAQYVISQAVVRALKRLRKSQISIKQTEESSPVNSILSILKVKLKHIVSVWRQRRKKNRRAPFVRECGHDDILGDDIGVDDVDDVDDVAVTVAGQKTKLPR